MGVRSRDGRGRQDPGALIPPWQLKNLLGLHSYAASNGVAGSATADLHHYVGRRYFSSNIQLLDGYEGGVATLNQLVTIGAPLLGSVLAGPPGLAIGAVSLVTQAMGLPNDSSEEAIVKEIKVNPEAAIKLNELESNYQQYLISVRLQMDQAEYADRAGARSREVDIAKATGKRDWYPPVIGTLVILSFTVILCTLVYNPNPKTQDDNTKSLINILVGALTAGYSTVLGYYFGSSAGSRNKDNTIASLTSSSSQPVMPTPLPITPLPITSLPIASATRKTWRDE